MHERHAEEFIAAVEKQVGDVLDYQGLPDVKAVFNVINAHISRGEVEDVRACLPKELQELWPEP